MSDAAAVVVAERFWRDAADCGVAAALPRPMEAAAQVALPLSIVYVQNLTAAAVRGWLAARNLGAGEVGNGDATRPLRGCLLAARDTGLIFVRAGDAADERRLTVAHEVAHFLLHYRTPRREVLAALGPAAAAVLDGDRPATLSERTTAALAGVRLGRHVHLLGTGGREDEAEHDADALAVELLAPAAPLRRVAARGEVSPSQVARLAKRHGVPREVMRRRLRDLRPPTPDPLVSWISATLRAPETGAA